MLSFSSLDKTHVSYRFFIGPGLMKSDGHELLTRMLLEEKAVLETTIPTKNIKDVIAVIFCTEEELGSIGHITQKIIILPKEEETTRLNVSFIDLNSLDEIDELILNLKVIKLERELDETLKLSEKKIDKLKKKEALHPFKIQEQIEYFEKCLKLEVTLLKDKSFSSWNDNLEKFTDKTNHFKRIMIGDRQDIKTLVMEDEISFSANEYYFNLYDENTIVYIEFNAANYEAYELLMNVLIRTRANSDRSLIKDDGEIDVWKNIFSKLPYPMAIISAYGDLLIHNESFAQLEILPKECLNYEDLKNFEIENQYFQLRRIPFEIQNIEVFYFVFYSSSTGTMKEGVDELGIISSSIAHELNNPLAGILAALSLLALEDDWSEESLNDINDMREGAKRCKELVEIFLGFSRFSTHSDNTLPIQNSLDQAINLLRFRMIESNLRIEVKYLSSLEKFDHLMNSSVLSMVFYLIFSELMTAFGHHKLLDNQAGGVISGQVMEFGNQIIIKLDNEFDFQKKIIQSKLITYLLKFEKIEMHTKAQEIKLVCKL